MVLFNYATKEITAKIVYYGPGLCGKTTNLQFIYDSLPSNNRSKMLSLATKTDRTLFFDFLPLDLGKIRGMRTKLQLYTVPGQVYYNSTRQLVLKGADGVVFVADSQDFALDANLESLQNLEDNLRRQGIRLTELPLVMQYNKRDLPNALSVAELDESLNKRMKVPSYESVATTGIGVENTLKGITQLVLGHLIQKYGLEGAEPSDREIQVLNPTVARESSYSEESVWAEEPPDAAQVVDDDDDDADIPLVETELISPGAESDSSNPFEDLIERFEQPPQQPAGQGVAPRQATAPGAPSQTSGTEYDPFSSSPPPAPPTEVPIGSVEVPLPEQLLQTFGAAPESPPPARSRTTAAVEELKTTGELVREVTIPINLSLEELRRHRKLKLRITLDVNLLP
jgi:mutual gliding-motility protein MglA